jgi:methylenetetrahydrofolate reductase (NADPH)
MTAPALRTASLLRDFSLEMTGKDAAEMDGVRGPAGTRINVTYLGNEDPGLRIAAVRAIRAAGYVPVPHIPARRLRSRRMLERFLAAVQAEGASGQLFIVGGDQATPQGPYGDALSVIRSGVLRDYGVRHVGITGYPEGHPDITGERLWRALEDKAAELGRQGLNGNVITQFGFDAEAVISWIERARDRGLDLPIRVGVPGPASVRRLVRYAARCGVGTSASITRKYGFSLTSLVGSAGPDRFLRDLAGRYDPGQHGLVGLHFYTFGGLAATSGWIARFNERELA